MLPRDLAQPLEIALGRRVDADRASHRLHDHGRDGRGVMQCHQPLELVGEMGAPLGLALREGVALQVERVGQVIDARQQRAEEHPVLDHAADRDAAEADTVIAALATDEPGARALADGPLIGERDLERGIDQLRARVREEHVVEVARHQRGQPRCQLESPGMAPLEGGCEVELGSLPLDRLDDPWLGVAGIAAPQPRGGVEYPTPFLGGVVHALGPREQARMRLEITVGREGHPEGFEIVRCRRDVAGQHAPIPQGESTLSAARSGGVNQRGRKAPLSRSDRNR